jgi:hypothetical protein
VSPSRFHAAAQTGSAAAAARVYLRIIAMDDDDASAWFNLGHAYESNGNFTAAGAFSSAFLPLSFFCRAADSNVNSGCVSQSHANRTRVT